jgi:pyrroline-5-carboxylate reductase
MPNTPAQIGEGVCGWSASSSVTSEQKQFSQTFLETFGMAISVSNENQVDAVGALSGCGPAYVFYFLEALIEGGVALGLKAEDARSLALQTLLGSVKLAQQKAGDLAGLQTLRAQVTSKGGATERAIASLESDQFKAMVAKAMEVAYQRMKELNMI